MRFPRARLLNGMKEMGKIPARLVQWPRRTEPLQIRMTRALSVLGAVRILGTLTSKASHPAKRRVTVGPTRAALSSAALSSGAERPLSSWWRAMPLQPCWQAKERRARGYQARPADGCAGRTRPTVAPRRRRVRASPRRHRRRQQRVAAVRGAPAPPPPPAPHPLAPVTVRNVGHVSACIQPIAPCSHASAQGQATRGRSARWQV